MDWLDFARLASAWLTEPGDAAWDLTCDISPAGGDGVININDLLILVNQWLIGNL